MSPGYAAVEVVSPISGMWELMSAGGRVIVFDTAQVAFEWLPLLGSGRPCSLDARSLSVCFQVISNVHPNRARVAPNYDPGEKAPWKRHIIWTDWWKG